jgi:hypothetical protein
MRGQAPLAVAVALVASAALLAVVSLSLSRQLGAVTALSSLQSAGTWANREPRYEPHVGDVLSKKQVRDFHPRRPGGGRAVAAATGQPPLVTALSERKVTGQMLACMF